ncbi:MAG: tRNA lysidine(34) synthetase TilS [Methyloceanibacter sp.]|nr:tRNA lysidine(34) synthetase TilS [Methyloceanibacter sp.]
MTDVPVTQAETDRILKSLARFRRVALAVSGGPDSLVLLYLGADFARRHGLAMPVALTVDHALRPGSRAEAETVARVARAIGVPHSILTWRHGPVDAAVQARARRARYDLMAAYCTAHDVPTLVTAHHLDDQAETFLMRLKRGSGLDGLAAIPEEGRWAGLTLLRPLLEIPKSRLMATAEALGLPFISDPSNEDPRFERVRLRGAMAALSEMGLEVDAIALSARRLRRARAALEAAADAFLDAHTDRSPAGYASVDLPALLAAPEEVALRALARVIGAVGGLSEPVRLAKLETLLAGLQVEPDEAQTLGRCQIVRARDRLAVYREIRNAGLPRAELRPGERLLWDNRFQVELGQDALQPVTVEALGKDGIETIGLPSNVPRLAACALPVCRLGDGRLVLPDFLSDLSPDFSQGTATGPAPLSRHEATVDCRARFLWGLS